MAGMYTSSDCRVQWLVRFACEPGGGGGQVLGEGVRGAGVVGVVGGRRRGGGADHARGRGGGRGGGRDAVHAGQPDSLEECLEVGGLALRDERLHACNAQTRTPSLFSNSPYRRL